MPTDTTETHKEWILSMIDQLRKRKARPDLERICHFVERKHGMGRKETEAHLETLVDQGIVIKVVYKRGTSYRNASKTMKRTYVSNVLNSNLASMKINEAVNQILTERRRRSSYISVTEEGDLKEEPMECDSDDVDGEEEEGVSSKDIENWFKANGEDIGPYPVHWAVQREVEAGRLTLLPNGTFAPFKDDKKLERPPYVSNDPSVSADMKPATSHKPTLPKSLSVFAKRGRPPKLRMSRFHKVSRSLSCPNTAVSKETDSEVEPESAPVPVMPPHLCDFCQQSSERNKANTPEELLFCKDCNAKAHPSCMNYSPELAARARNTPWQCIDCKTCCICSDPGDADAMLFCDACDKGYHMNCHEPEVVDKPQGKWVCSECVTDGVDIDDISDSSYVADSTVKFTDTDVCNGSGGNINGEKESPPREIYPNATNWSTSDVVNYFHEKGFTEQANAFKEQEIDGQSLLLLKRSDVLQGLSLKLGPALKIYNHVMRLQTAGQPMT